ncbi:DoxX family protein [Adhaeribacter pallidiroseus]|uniref:DoxX family protein n=1 Tax=Adhaeribacter pallidiroseus TaxID=2072847 RepID=A0A369QLW1_9BACT|nr:DoxX family protein [Adhaeribacter pallidiroseus]RDC64227.1 hypothetical protein AHMF7616_02839 [Adhaeribacter pallidiroseus]
MTNLLNFPVTSPYSKYRITVYWLVTVFLVFELFYGALWDFNLLNKGYVYSILNHLGYPLYLAAILAIGKIAAAVVILIPGLWLLKEWAYAGVVILFIGGFLSHVIVGDGFGQFIWSLLFGIMALVSWKLNYQSDKVKSILIK